MKHRKVGAERWPRVGLATKYGIPLSDRFIYVRTFSSHHVQARLFFYNSCVILCVRTVLYRIVPYRVFSKLKIPPEAENRIL